jgi:hypothetical protein
MTCEDLARVVKALRSELAEKLGLPEGRITGLEIRPDGNLDVRIRPFN